jgi:hypothetical protein
MKKKASSIEKNPDWEKDGFDSVNSNMDTYLDDSLDTGSEENFEISPENLSNQKWFDESVLDYDLEDINTDIAEDELFRAKKRELIYNQFAEENKVNSMSYLDRETEIRLFLMIIPRL